MPTLPPTPPEAAPTTAAPPSPADPGPRRVFVTVAEVSGDRHAAQFIRSLKRIDPTIEVEGLGGPEMAAAGAVIHRDTVARAAMGWRGALRAVEIGRVLKWTKRRFDAHRPDVWVGVDSPSMNFHFARAAHDRGIPTLQYVAPQLWAWAPWRMKKLRRWVDRLACILPFEEAWFRGHGVDATFVGHPLFDELPPNRARAAEGGGEPRFPDRPPVIGLLPGSRKSIAGANFPNMLREAGLIEEAFPDATFLVPTTEATHPVVEAALSVLGNPGATGSEPPPPRRTARPGRVEYRLNAFDDLVPRCDLCLTVSGTATLHVAGFGVPMVVVYRGSPVLYQLIGRWLFQVRTFAMVNLLAAPDPTRPDPGGHIVPEFVPWYGPPGPVAAAAIDLLRHPDRLADQGRRLGELIRALDKPGASDRVARLAVDMMAGAPIAGRGTPAPQSVAAV